MKLKKTKKAMKAVAITTGVVVAAATTANVSLTALKAGGSLVGIGWLALGEVGRVGQFAFKPFFLERAK